MKFIVHAVLHGACAVEVEVIDDIVETRLLGEKLSFDTPCYISAQDVARLPAEPEQRLLCTLAVIRMAEMMLQTMNDKVRAHGVHAPAQGNLFGGGEGDASA